MKNANEVLKRYWDGRLPVNLHDIANQEYIRVVPIEDSSLSGCYDVQDNEPVIKFNIAEHPRRRRFTIAHELGHHFLNHGPAMRDSPENLAGQSQDPKEIEANNFAACLLMPESVVRRLIQTGEVRSITELANRFDVSEIAMQYRLRNLGII